MCVSGGECPKVKKEKVDIIYVKYNRNTVRWKHNTQNIHKTNALEECTQLVVGPLCIGRGDPQRWSGGQRPSAFSCSMCVGSSSLTRYCDGPPALGTRSLNHWTIREVPDFVN